MAELGVSKGAMDSLKSKVSINELKIDENGDAKSNSIVINTAVGMGLSIMIYFFIFLYGVQVMRGVIEEKTNRIVELMISSLKPFELMMGKVIGIAAVGLTQLGIWIVLSSVLTLIISAVFGINMADGMDASPVMQSGQMPEMNGKLANVIAAFVDLPLLKIFSLFIFYFLGGYLLYGALFAAIGSAVDSETDTQQFMMPVTLPLVFSFIVSFSVVINDPNGGLATWLSMIPISSPIVMMSRIPFDPPTWQIIVSMLSLVITIFLVILLAGRIYRTGISDVWKKAFIQGNCQMVVFTKNSYLSKMSRLLIILCVLGSFFSAEAQNDPIFLGGHVNDVTSVAYSPDGQYIVTGCWGWTCFCFLQ